MGPINKYICIHPKMKICLLLTLVATLTALVYGNTYQFGCYAPPLVYGGWCSSNHGIMGSATVTISVEPLGDTQLTCQMN